MPTSVPSKNSPRPLLSASILLFFSRFSAPAFAQVVLIQAAAISVGLAAVGLQIDPPESPYFVLAAIVGGGVVAGAALGWRFRRLGFWELVCGTLIVALSALGFGLFGLKWELLSHLPGALGRLALREAAMVSPIPLHKGSTLLAHGTGLEPLAPGAVFFGATWWRPWATYYFLALLEGLTAASLTFMARAQGRGFERFVSWRYLSEKRHDRRISTTAVIAALGVSVGVAALISVVSAMSGYQADVKEKILNTNAHLIVQRFGRTFDDYDDVEQKLDQVPGVLASSPFVFTGGMLSAPRGMFAVLLKGVDVDRIGKVTRLREQLRGVDIVALRPGGDGPPGMIVGKELWQQLDLKVGDLVSLVSPVGTEGKRGAPPKTMPFRLLGTFSSGMNEFDQKLVYVELSAAQKFIGEDTGITGLEVRTADPEHVADTAKRVVTSLGGFPYRTIDWRQLNAGIFNALSMQKTMMVILLVFIIVVAAFNIASTLFMLVVEKTREVAVLKAMGAEDGSVMKIFVLQGHVISAVGVVFGVGLGLVLCAILGQLRFHIAADVYLVDTLRVLVQPQEVALIVLGAVQVAHLATLYPALSAARLAPVVAMRYG